jgi:uncharacterized protein (TIGR03086 family)
MLDRADMAELAELFNRAVDGFERHVRSVRADQWHNDTPDTEWDVRVLVNHVTVEQLWVPPLLEGKTIADIGDALDGDQLGDDPVATWQRAARDSRAAFGTPGVMQRSVVLSSGSRPVEEYAWEMTTDALIHSWDLARGIGADDTMDPELVDLIYERTLPFVDGLAATGLFAPPVPVPDDADPQTKLLAIFGRKA